jgi:D-glycero-D-manno-heptose 1,7-bisphosphate phosphatase
MELRRGAFFDRDGVINVSPEPGRYVRSWEEFQLIPEAVEWIRLFNAIEMPVIVVTNQRGISRGLVNSVELARIHSNMRAALSRRGARVDDVYHCPHEENECDCRKPGPEMFYQAARKWKLDLRRSVVLGDSWRDRDAAAKIGAHFVAVREGHLIGVLPQTQLLAY